MQEHAAPAQRAQRAQRAQGSAQPAGFVLRSVLSTHSGRRARRGGWVCAGVAAAEASNRGLVGRGAGRVGARVSDLGVLPPGRRTATRADGAMLSRRSGYKNSPLSGSLLFPAAAQPRTGQNPAAPAAKPRPFPTPPPVPAPKILRRERRASRERLRYGQAGPGRARGAGGAHLIRWKRLRSREGSTRRW